MITSVGEDVEKLELLGIAGGKTVRLLWKTVQQFLKKLNRELSHDPAIPLLGTHPREMKSCVQKSLVHSCHRSFVIVRNGKRTSVHQQMNRQTKSDTFLK